MLMASHFCLIVSVHADLYVEEASLSISDKNITATALQLDLEEARIIIQDAVSKFVTSSP